MTRTKLKDRTLPPYTRGEEVFNMVTHIVGGALGVAALVLCLWRSVAHGDTWALVGSIIYGCTLIALYTVSSVYHGLRPGMGKKVMQVLDHCTIYFLISGTYTPILFTAIRRESPQWAWVLFALVWGLAALATVFTAIDLKRYARFSMACYLGMGWCIVLAARTAIAAIAPGGLWFLLAGGIAYTVGAALYGVGKQVHYMHSIFHIFVVLGSLLQFISIYVYML